MSSLSSTLINAANSLQVYDQAFNVIENNITNANTPGYVTQKQSLVAEPFGPRNCVQSAAQLILDKQPSARQTLASLVRFMTASFRAQSQSRGQGKRGLADGSLAK